MTARQTYIKICHVTETLPLMTRVVNTVPRQGDVLTLPGPGGPFDVKVEQVRRDYTSDNDIVTVEVSRL